MNQRIDMHQHLWSEPLIDALAARRELPFVRSENGQAVLHLARERPCSIDTAAEATAQRAALVWNDCVDRALLCLSSPLGIEWLERDQSLALIAAYHEGAIGLGDPFGVWGAIPLQAPDAADVDRALELGCVGVSLPAGALASVRALERVREILARLEVRQAPLLVHPGPGSDLRAGGQPGENSASDPPWWPALTSYVSDMQAAWLAFATAGRSRHPRLRVVFTMLAGLAPMQVERLAARGGPRSCDRDSLLFYETSSYGPAAIDAVAQVVGHEQLLYGSDRPVLDPAQLGALDRVDWGAIAEASSRALGGATVQVPG
jgi:hypothetical protein